MADSIEDAIRDVLTSPDVSDSNEYANVVDVINEAARGAFAIANAITPRGAAAGTDANGGHVESLTEAVMGMTAGLHAIADALREVAGAIEGHE